MSRSVRSIPAVFLLLLMVCSGARAQLTATEILRKSYEAEARLRFSGELTTSVYSANGTVAADVRIQRDARRSRMEYRTGPSAKSTIIDDGKSFIRLDASTRTAHLSGTPEAPENLTLLLRNYQPRIEGSEKVAGRDCHIIRLVPRHKGNPAKSLWVDKSTFLALKTKRYRSDGKLAVLTEYSDIDFSSKPAASSFAVPKGWKTVRTPGVTAASSLAGVQKHAGFAPVKPGYVPKGYSLEGYFTGSMQGGCPAGGLRYSNGLNTLSVFQWRAQGMGRGFGGTGRGRRGGRGEGAGRGAAVAAGPNVNLVRTTVGGISIVIVGDIAEAELRKMADSIK